MKNKQIKKPQLMSLGRMRDIFGTVVRQATGITAKDWIDRALITHIMVELRHTDKNVVQISEEMNFPNPAFFSKFFKRLTRQTPIEYREQRSIR